MLECKIKVFVYGSLRIGFGNHSNFLGNSDFIGKAKTLPQYSIFSLGPFPGVIKNGETSIQGEIYSVTEEELGRLDSLESHPNWYKREVIETDKGDAWIYLLDSERYGDKEIIKSGIWEL